MRCSFRCVQGVERACGCSAMKARGRRAADLVARLRLPATAPAREPITTASDTAATAPAPSPRRGCRSPRPPARCTCAPDARHHRGHRGGVEVAGAGHALERHVVDVAAGDAADLLHALLGRGRRQQEDRVEPGARSVGGEGLAFLGRVVDHQHAVDAGRRRRRATKRRRMRCRSARPGWRSPSAPPACVALRCAEPAHHASTCGMPMPRASARSAAFWITGPSAIGSENGTPSSITSAPPSASAMHDVDRGVGVRVAGGDVGDQRLAALRLQRVEGGGDAAHRFTSMLRHP